MKLRLVVKQILQHKSLHSAGMTFRLPLVHAVNITEAWSWLLGEHHYEWILQQSDTNRAEQLTEAGDLPRSCNLIIHLLYSYYFPSTNLIRQIEFQDCWYLIKQHCRISLFVSLFLSVLTFAYGWIKAMLIISTTVLVWYWINMYHLYALQIVVCFHV